MKRLLAFFTTHISACGLTEFAQLVSKQLVGMLLIILVKKKLKSCFGDIKTTAVGAGILGVMVWSS